MIKVTIKRNNPRYNRTDYFPDLRSAKLWADQYMNDLERGDGGDTGVCAVEVENENLVAVR